MCHVMLQCYSLVGVTINDVVSSQSPPQLITSGGRGNLDSMYCISVSPESRFPRPLLVMSRGGDCDETTSLIVTPTRLQHRSMTRHIETMVRWAEDLAARGGRGAVHPTVGSPRMEVKKFGRSYGGGGAGARSDGRRWKKVSQSITHPNPVDPYQIFFFRLCGLLQKDLICWDTLKASLIQVLISQTFEVVY